MKKNKGLSQSAHAFLHKRTTPMLFFSIALVSIILIIVYGFIVSFLEGEPWETTEACVENLMLLTCLIFIHISYRKEDEGLIETFLGEILAIMLVTNISYLAELISYLIKDGFKFVSIMFMVMQLTITFANCELFVRHFKSHSKRFKQKKSSEIGKGTMLFMLILVTVIFIVDTVVVFLTNEKDMVLLLIDQLIYLVFMGSMYFAIMSMISISQEAKRELKENNG